MPTIKIRNNSGLDIKDKEFRKEFPAIFSNRRHSTMVSEDYQMYRSDQIIDIMAEHGLKLVEVSQERAVWSKVRQPHTAIHTMRFQAEGTNFKEFGVGDSFPEIAIINSHDGRRQFRAMAGVFRLVCANGMIVADSNFGSVSRRHYGAANAFDKVKEIIAELPKTVNQISQRIADWSALDMTPDAQLALARMMMRERLPCGGMRAPDWLLPEQVLEHRRPLEAPKSDGSRDLWTTFNVLQESLTNAKIDRLAGEGRARSISPINGAVDNTGYNSKLWATAEAYYAEQSAALEGGERDAFEKVRAARGRKAKKLLTA